MNISLTSELEQLVYEKVNTGMYNSASEVIREALRLLKERDQFREIRLQELRKELQIGIKQLKQGKGIPAKDVLHELRERNHQHQNKQCK